MRAQRWFSRQIGLVFEYQGRFGAAVKSMQDAVKSFREQGENGLSMAGLLNDLRELWPGRAGATNLPPSLEKRKEFSRLEK
jgi:hypothetical protein